MKALLVIVILTQCTACVSTANDWKPHYTLPDHRQYQVCVQRGNKMYDEETGKECLTREQQRRKDNQGVKHPGA